MSKIRLLIIIPVVILTAGMSSPRPVLAASDVPAAPATAGQGDPEKVKAVAPQKLPLEITTELAGSSDRLPSDLVRGGITAVSVRRYMGQPDSEAARKRVVEAFSFMLRQNGFQIAQDGQVADVTIEIDPYFFVWSSKFQGRRLRLTEYVGHQMQGTQPAEEVAVPAPSTDALRVLGGAVGFVSGLLSPAHAGAMVASTLAPGTGVSGRMNEATYALFGRPGSGPLYLQPDLRERINRGQQSFTTVIRVQTPDHAFQLEVRSFIWGDDPPFHVEQLAAENFSRVVHSLDSSQPSSQARP